MECRELEVCCQAGARTGKSFSLMLKAEEWAAKKAPGCRQLFVRKTRKSMNDTILPDWENEILCAGHPALTRGPKHRKDRDYYNFGNGSEIVLAGFDSQEKINDILSSKWDRIYVFQAEQIRKDDWEKLCSRLTAFNTPYHQIVADVNPAPISSWVAKKFGIKKDGSAAPPEGKAVFGYRLQDNPMWFDADTGEFTPEGEEVYAILDATLTGPRRQRLLLHRWVSAEGSIWETYDPDKHYVAGECRLVSPDDPDEGFEVAFTEPGHWFEGKALKVGWFGASIDFGFNNPVCLQLWAVCGDVRVLVAEVYRHQMDIEELAEATVRLYKEYRFVMAFTDHDPGLQRLLNQRCSRVAGREMPGLFRNWTKARDKSFQKAGIDQVRVGFRQDTILLLRDTLQHAPDAVLSDKGEPLCTEEEIAGYVYRSFEERDMPNREAMDDPDPTVPQHGCDAMRAFMYDSFLMDLTPSEEETGYEVGTYGRQLFKGKWDEIRKGRTTPRQLREAELKARRKARGRR